MSKSKYRPKYHYGNSGPRWWRNVHSTRPLRREARQLAHLAQRGMAPDELPELSPWNRVRPWYW